MSSVVGKMVVPVLVMNPHLIAEFRFYPIERQHLPMGAFVCCVSGTSIMRPTKRRLGQCPFIARLMIDPDQDDDPLRHET